jgi:hypothetical protein
MGIRISERDEVFHIPYGLPNSDGTPESSFVDLKANPALVPVLAPCLGWPETRDLLKAVNAPESPLMTLAADQGFTTTEQPEHLVALTSFVTLSYAEVERNRKPAMADLAERLDKRMSAVLQAVSHVLQRTLFLNVTLELQPTIFHHQGLDGWSLTVLMAAYGGDERDARLTWRMGVKALQAALTDHDAFLQ